MHLEPTDPVAPQRMAEDIVFGHVVRVDQGQAADAARGQRIRDFGTHGTATKDDDVLGCHSFKGPAALAHVGHRMSERADRCHRAFRVNAAAA